jgi:hypothetical protein
MFIRTSGRTSPASTPSLRATSTVSTPPLRLTITCCTRGSRVRTSASTRRSNATFASLANASTGSSAGYSWRPLLRASACPACWRPSRAIARADCADAINAAASRSSEYAKPVFSPEIARTPTPCSIACAPSLTMPSSMLQLSRRACWKYRSPKSMPGPSRLANARCSASVSRPAGASKRDSAMASAFMGPASECVATG